MVTILSALALLMPVSGMAQGLVPVGARQLVIPFENVSREPRVYWLSEASAVVLTDDLIALGAQAIARDDRLRAFERLRVPPVASLSHATVIRIGQLVGAAQVIVGAFDVKGDIFTVRARAIRLDTGRIFPEIVESGPLPDVLLIYARVARRLAPDSRVSLEQMEQEHPPLPAFEQYVKGVLAENPTTRIAFLTEALRLSPAFQRARLALWEVQTEQGEHQQALDIVRQVPSDHRLGRRARFLAALSLLDLSQHAAAFDALTTLNQLQPDPALLNALGVVQLRRPSGAPGGKATEYFTDATRADPNDADLFFNLGYAYWLERNTGDAITALREAVRRNPADDVAHYVLGVALQSAGSTTEATREKELARRLSSMFADWEKQGSGTPVPRGLERLEMTFAADSGMRVDEVIVAAGQRDQQELARFYLESGRRLFQTERDVQAISELRRAIYLAPYSNEAHLLLGRAYLRTGQLAEAVDALKISIWSSDTIAAHLALAEAYIAAKDLQTARMELQQILAREPSNGEARQLLERAGN